MRKRLGVAVGVTALAFVLSSCWAIQNFTIADYTLTPGQATKAKLTLRSMGPEYQGVVTGARQFLIVGISAVSIGQDTDIGVSNARWGVNGQYGGPIGMVVENDIITSVGTNCQGGGLNFADISGVLWKAFATPTNKNDQGKVEAKSVIEVTLKSKAAQVDAGENYTVMAVAGAWTDDGDGTPEGSDGFICWGIVTSAVHAN